MTFPTLAAIRFDGVDIDALLAEIAETLMRRGLHVCGVLQRRDATDSACRCADMDLQVIGTARVFRISQPLGDGSSGCRLHPGALADCAAFLEGEIAAGADLLILNRFGRGESEGRGFRDLIAQAVAAGIPVLTAVRPAYAPAWAAFCGDAAHDLPPERSRILAWFETCRHPPASAG